MGDLLVMQAAAMLRNLVSADSNQLHELNVG
jgi:hypothetical protein